MLVREGDERTSGLNLALAIIFSSVAGAVNSAGFYAYGIFSANMTGNASSLSDQIVLKDVPASALFAALLGAFIVGAAIASAWIEAGQLRGDRMIYAKLIFAAGSMQMLVSVVAVTTQDPPVGAFIVAALAGLMGLQNATTSKLSGMKVRTTHVTGMATDIGIALGRALTRQPITAAASETVRLHICTLSAFIAGGVAGVLGYRAFSGAVFAVTGAILIACSVPTWWKREPRS